MPLSEWSEKQLLMLTAGIVAGVLLIMAGVVFYKYSQYAELQEQTELTKRQVQKLEIEANRLDEVQKRLNEASLSKQWIEEKVPGEKRIDDLIEQINEQSKNANLTISKMGVKKVRTTGRRVTKPPTYEPITMSIECEGGYHEMGRFINRIETRMARLATISGFKIEGYEEGLKPGEKKLSIELELTAYKYNAKKKPAAPKQ